MAKLKDLSISFLSLVKTPATGKGLHLKSLGDDQRAEPINLVVKNDDMMRAYGIVYAPDQEDAHGDTADADTIRKAATEFMREGRLKNIDTEHSFTAEMAFVAESWLVRKGDALFGDEPEGAWAVGIQIGDPDLWKQLKSGDLTGISLAGIARTDPPEEPRQTYTEKGAPGWVDRLIKALTGAPQPVEETDMDEKQVQEIVEKTVTKTVGDAVTAALKSAGIDVPDKPETGGDDQIASQIDAAVAAALKKAGVDPKVDDPEPETDIEKAVAKAMKGLTDSLDDKIAKALAKGETVTTGVDTATTEESFL